MLPGAADILMALSVLGIPVILVLFYLDGMIVGKVAPPAALYVAYVVLSTASTAVIVLFGVACVISSTLGQITIFRGFNEDSPEFVGIRRTVPYADSIPSVVKGRIGNRRMEIVSGLFDRYGGVAICVTNVIPGVRCLMAIPAGLSGYPRFRFFAFATLGNIVYLGLLTAVAMGVGMLGRFVPVI